MIKAEGYFPGLAGFGFDTCMDCDADLAVYKDEKLYCTIYADSHLSRVWVYFKSGRTLYYKDYTPARLREIIDRIKEINLQRLCAYARTQFWFMVLPAGEAEAEKTANL